MNNSRLNRADMGIIDQLVQEILKTGYLSLEVEKQLRYLLQMTKYSQKDFHAFIQLQHAALDGSIRQESREVMFSKASYS
ncbi:MAG: hypothetical protein WBA13_17555 [Microcoleaceae cyanobacterium]